MAITDIRRNLYAYLLNKAQLFTDIRPDQLEVPNWYATGIEIANVAVLPDCISIPGVAVSHAFIDKLIFSVGIGGIKIDVRGFHCSLSLTEMPSDGAFTHAMEESVHDLLDALQDNSIDSGSDGPTSPIRETGYGIGDTKGLFTRLAELALSQIQVTIDSALVECVLPSGTILKLDIQRASLSSAKLQAAKLTLRQGMMAADGKARLRRSSRDSDRDDTTTSMNEGVSLLLASQVLEFTDFACMFSSGMDEVNITAVSADLNVVPVLENLGELLNHFVFNSSTNSNSGSDSSNPVEFNLDVKFCKLRQESCMRGSGEICTSISLVKNILRFGEIKVGESIIPSPSLSIDFGNELSVDVYNPISLDLSQKQFASLLTFLLDVNAAVATWNLPQPTSQAQFSLMLPEIKLAVEDKFSILMFPELCNNNITKIRELVVIAQSSRVILNNLTLSTPWIPEAWCFSAKKLVVNAGPEVMELYQWVADLIGPSISSQQATVRVPEREPQTQVINIDLPDVELNVNGYLQSHARLRLRCAQNWSGDMRFEGSQGNHCLEADVMLCQGADGSIDIQTKNTLVSLDAGTIFTLADYNFGSQNKVAHVDASQATIATDNGSTPVPVKLATQGKLYLNAGLKYETDFQLQSEFNDVITFKTLDPIQFSVEDEFLKPLIQLSGLDGKYDLRRKNFELVMQEARGGFCADSLESLISTLSTFSPAKPQETFKTSVDELGLDVFEGVEEPMQQLSSLIQSAKSTEHTNEDSIGALAEYLQSHVSVYEGGSLPEAEPIVPICDYFKPSRSSVEAPRPVQIGSGNVTIRIRKLSLSLYDGFDLTATQNSLMNAVDKLVKDSLIKSERLFDSVYIGTDENNQTRDRLLQKITGDLGSTTGFSRSRKPKVVLAASGLELQASGLLDSDSPTADLSEYRLTLARFSVRDKHPKSTYSHMITTLDRQVSTEAGVLNVSVTNLNLPNSESRVKIDLCPLRISIFGGTLDFLTRFFQFQPSASQLPNHAPQSSTTADSSNGTFFQRLEIQRLPLVLDYRPSPSQMAGIGSQSMREVLSLISVEQATVVLNHVILRGVQGMDAVGKALAAIWTPDILSRQLLGLLSGFGPWRHLQDVGERVRRKANHHKLREEASSPFDEAQDMSASVLYIKNSRGANYPARAPKSS